MYNVKLYLNSIQLFFALQTCRFNLLVEDLTSISQLKKLDMEIDSNTEDAVIPSLSKKPIFKALTASEMSNGKMQFRKIPVPAHRYTPLKKAWMEIYTPVNEQMTIDIRMNLKVLNFSLFLNLIVYADNFG